MAVQPNGPGPASLRTGFRFSGGEEIELSRELIATVVETSHTVPSLGFVIWDRRKKLKPEYLDLPGEKIRDLRLNGVEITNEIRVPLVCYMGTAARRAWMLNRRYTGRRF